MARGGRGEGETPWGIPARGSTSPLFVGHSLTCLPRNMPSVGKLLQGAVALLLLLSSGLDLGELLQTKFFDQLLAQLKFLDLPTGSQWIGGHELEVFGDFVVADVGATIGTYLFFGHLFVRLEPDAGYHFLAHEGIEDADDLCVGDLGVAH